MLQWTRICRDCKEAKLTLDFYKDVESIDGLSSQCIKCLIVDRDHVTEGNIFEDLGFSRDELEDLKKE